MKDLGRIPGAGRYALQHAEYRESQYHVPEATSGRTRARLLALKLIDEDGALTKWGEDVRWHIRKADLH